MDRTGILLLLDSNSLHCFFDEKLLSFMISYRVRQMILGLGCDLDIRFVNLLSQTYKLISFDDYKMIFEYLFNKLKFWEQIQSDQWNTNKGFISYFVIKIMDSLQSIYKQRNNQYKITLYSQPSQGRRFNNSEFEKPLSTEKIKYPLASLESDRSRLNRFVPKNIMKDKETLYSDVLSLKKHINKYAETNQKLKTRVLMLQTSRGKIEQQKGGSLQKTGRQIKILDQSPKREGLLIAKLKKIANKYRCEWQELKGQHIKLKRLLKYSQINQLNITTHQYLQQNKRLSSIIADLQQKLLNYEQMRQQLQLLQKRLLQQKRGRHKAQQKNMELQNSNTQIQNKIKNQIEKFTKKQKNLVNQIFIERRKAINIQNSFDNFRKESERSKEMSVHSNNHKTEIKMPRTLNEQMSFLSNKRQFAINPLFKISTPTSTQSREPRIDITEENLKLKKDIEELQKRLKNVEIKLQNKNSIKNIEELQNEESLNDTGHKSALKEDVHLQHKQNSNIQKIESSSQYETIQNESKQIQKPLQNKAEIILDQIRELLTFRFQDQNYTYSEIKRDIQNSQSKEFSCVDICHILVNEPFYLTVEYSKVVLNFIFQKQKIKKEEVVDPAQLVSKLRRLINDFEAKSDQKQKSMIQHCILITQQYSNDIKSAFLSNKNGFNTISVVKIIQILTQYGFSEDQRRMIIGELSIFSENLQHLNFQIFFQRFYVESIQDNSNNEVIVSNTNELQIIQHTQ